MENKTESKIVITIANTEHATNLYRALNTFLRLASDGGKVEMLIRRNGVLLDEFGVIGSNVHSLSITHEIPATTTRQLVTSDSMVTSNTTEKEKLISGITDDPNDPRLVTGHAESGQNEVYLVLSEEERRKGFVRPYRTAYRHGGEYPKYALRDLSDEEHKLYDRFGYVAYEEYPESEAPITGRYWTQVALDAKGCGSTTTMGKAVAETYARDPHFYNSTFCCQCNNHFPVQQFVWVDDGTVVGS